MAYCQCIAVNIYTLWVAFVRKHLLRPVMQLYLFILMWISLLWWWRCGSRKPFIKTAHWMAMAANSMLNPDPLKPYRTRNVARNPNPMNIITWISWNSVEKIAFPILPMCNFMKSDINFKHLAVSLLIACGIEKCFLSSTTRDGVAPHPQTAMWHTFTNKIKSNHIHFKYVHMDRNFAIGFDMLKVLKKKKKEQPRN